MVISLVSYQFLIRLELDCWHQCLLSCRRDSQWQDLVGEKVHHVIELSSETFCVRKKLAECIIRFSSMHVTLHIFVCNPLCRCRWKTTSIVWCELSASLAGRTRKSGVSGLYNFAVFCGLLEYLLSLIQKEIFELSNGWLPAHLGDQNQDTNLNSTLPLDMITGEV